MKPSVSSWLVLALVTCAYASDAYKILVVFPMPGKSHTILGEGVVRHLAAAGHEITFITSTIRKNPPPNVRQIDVTANYKLLKEDMLSIQNIMDKNTSTDVKFIMEMMMQVHNETLFNPNVQALLLNPEERFDLIIVEWMFSELYSSFSAIFNAPYVWVSTVEPHWMVLRLIDERSNPAYTADITSANTYPFSFKERVQQLLIQIGISALKYFYINTFENKVYNSLEKYIRLRGREPPAFKEVVFNASLILGNSHVSLGQAMTLPPNYINVGGYHIESNPKPLPDDLQKLLDNAKHGLIYFSMGSNLRSKDLPDQVKRDLLKMFGALKQTVLWKFEEVLPDMPDNVHILNWAPQPSILAHPNCVLFITHGGLLSTTETIQFATPIIGVPVFADQFINVERAVKKGFAKRVDLSYQLAAELKVAIDEVLNDPSYTNKVKELSFVYHDRTVPPGAELVHWVEHVIKTNGAPHLRSPALDVPIYQKLYLDFAALVLVAIYLIVTAFKRIFGKTSTKSKRD
nr:uridine diphosphate-glycosyltransferases 40AP4 [Glyphodes pyloalis]